MIKVYWLDLTLQKWRYILQRWRGMGFFSQSTATCNSPTAFLQLMWASAGINICAHVNIPNSGSPTIIWPYGQHCAHWQEWVVLLLWMADWAETKIFFPSGSCCCNCTQLRTPKCPASYEWNILYVNNFQKFKKKRKKKRPDLHARTLRETGPSEPSAAFCPQQRWLQNNPSGKIDMALVL